MKKTIEVKLENKTVKISKLPLGKYAELLGAIEDIPKSLGQFDGLTNEDFLAQLPKLVSVALPDVIKVLAIATPLTPDEIEDLGLDEVVELVAGIVEVNNYKSVFANIKKMTAQQTPAKTA